MAAVGRVGPAEIPAGCQGAGRLRDEVSSPAVASLRAPAEGRRPCRAVPADAVAADSDELPTG